jgi:exonuclease SbcD
VRYDLADEHWPSPEAKRRALAEGLRAVVDQLAKEASESARGTPIVLCGHFLVRGVSDGLYQLTEQEGVPVEPSDIPAYAYVALGHIHKGQQVGSPSVRYCGSLERMDLGERSDSKHALLVEVAKSGLQDVKELAVDATPFALIEASSQADLESAAASMVARERTLVALRLTLSREDSAGLLQARARDLFPRVYSPAEIVWRDAPGQSNEAMLTGTDWRDPPHFVHQYLESRLTDDPEREELMRLVDELMAEEDSR